MTEPPISNRDKSIEIAREIMMRERVYPREIAQGRMTWDMANKRLAIMKAIHEDYLAKADAEAEEKLL